MKETELESGGFGTRCRGKEQAQAKNVPTKPRDSGTLGSALRPWSVAAAGKPLMELSQEHFPPPVCPAGAAPRGEHPGHPTPRPGTPHPGEQPGHATSHMEHSWYPTSQGSIPHIPPRHPTSRGKHPGAPAFREKHSGHPISQSAAGTPHILPWEEQTGHPISRGP